MKPLVVLVTSHHPYTSGGGEVMFVGPEVERLAREDAFDLVIAPLDDRGPRVSVPDGVKVDTTLARRTRGGRWLDVLLAWSWPGLRAEWRRAGAHGGVVGLARVWRWAAQARAVYAWASRTLDATRPTLVYTYWRGGATLAGTRLAHEHAPLRVVTRVHGYELYESRFSPPFQPWTSMYQHLDRVYAISAHGRDHLLARGVEPARVALHRLGVDDVRDDGGAPPEEDDPESRHVLSCSFMLPLKRVPLIAAAMLAIARRRPDVRFTWTHFGDGADMSRVRDVVRETPPNLAVELPGHRPNEIVRAHYRSTRVDAFVLASTHEGLPVSVQEALAAGVPVVATAVGGVPEAVGSDNGVLLDAAVGADELAAALEQVLFAPPDVVASRRRASRARWERDFDAERNHAAFAAALRARVQALTTGR